jgi:hypothetical protein
MSPRFRYRTFLMLLVLALAAGCKFKFGGDDTDDANKLIGEAKAGIAAADKMAQDAYTKYQSYANAETMRNFPSNRDDIRPAAQQSADLFGKSAAAYREQVISKLEAAGKLDIKDKFREYITLKAEAFRKLADSKDAGKELALAPLDPSLTTGDELLAKSREIDARINDTVKQFEEVNERANKVQQENPGLINAPQ